MKFKNIFANWRKTFKLGTSDPKSFEEKWSVNTSRIQVVSLFFVFLVILTFLIGLLLTKTSLSEYFIKDAARIDRDKVVEQKMQIDKLAKRLDAQEKYIENIKMIISGKTPADTVKKIKSGLKVDPSKINTSLTKSERKIAAKVKDDLRTKVKKSPLLSIHFITPVQGIVSQKFDAKVHPGIDVVTPKGVSVSACLSGTVIYAGYSQKDGHFLIIEHANDFISVYKHNQSKFKKTGDKVRTGDPIAIVGNTGENSTGPHLHFELWLNQKPIDPTEYMRFKKM